MAAEQTATSCCSGRRPSPDSRSASSGNTSSPRGRAPWTSRRIASSSPWLGDLSSSSTGRRSAASNTADFQASLLHEPQPGPPALDAGFHHPELHPSSSGVIADGRFEGRPVQIRGLRCLHGVRPERLLRHAAAAGKSSSAGYWQPPRSSSRLLQVGEQLVDRQWLSRSIGACPHSGSRQAFPDGLQGWGEEYRLGCRPGRTPARIVRAGAVDRSIPVLSTGRSGPSTGTVWR